MAIDTDNTQNVSLRGDVVFVSAPRVRMTREEALLHAAWLVAVADPNGLKFAEYLEAVQQT